MNKYAMRLQGSVSDFRYSSSSSIGVLVEVPILHRLIEELSLYRFIISTIR